MKKQWILIIFCALIFVGAAKASAFPMWHIIPLESGVKIKLDLDGKTYDIQNSTFAYYPTQYAAEEKDEKKEATYQNYSFTFVMKASKLDQELVNWLTSKDGKPKSGKVVFSDVESGKTLRTITFKTAKSSGYSESADAGSENYGSPSSVSFGIICQEATVKIGN